MLPAVSAEDCLVADLGVDPGERGWQSWEATELLLRGFRPDPTAGLVLWQVDGIGKLDWNLDPDPRGLQRAGRGAGRALPARARARLLPRVDLPDRGRRDERTPPRRARRRSRAPPAGDALRPAAADQAGRPGDGRAARRSRRRSRALQQGAGALDGDDCSPSLVQPDRPLDALARAPSRRVAERSTTGRARAGRRHGGRAGRSARRSRAPPARPLRLVERARIGEEPCAGEAVEHLRPEVLLGRGRLDLADERFRLGGVPRACSVRASIAATEARWPISPRLPSAS